VDPLLAREPGGELHHVAVEERRAQIEGAHGAGAIGLGQQALGEGGLQIVELQAVEQLGA
jgi:hypothetical protein